MALITASDSPERRQCPTCTPWILVAESSVTRASSRAWLGVEAMTNSWSMDVSGGHHAESPVIEDVAVVDGVAVNGMRRRAEPRRD